LEGPGVAQACTAAATVGGYCPGAFHGGKVAPGANVSLVVDEGGGVEDGIIFNIQKKKKVSIYFYYIHDNKKKNIIIPSCHLI
jgi:hypothetical protein